MMAMEVVEAIYKFKYLLSTKKENGENGKSTGNLVLQGSHIYWKTWKNIVHLKNLQK